MTLQDAYRAHYTALLRVECELRKSQEGKTNAAALGAEFNNCIACGGMVYALQDGKVEIDPAVQDITFDDTAEPERREQ